MRKTRGAPITYSFFFFFLSSTRGGWAGRIHALLLPHIHDRGDSVNIEEVSVDGGVEPLRVLYRLQCYSFLYCCSVIRIHLWMTASPGAFLTEQ